MGVTDNDPSQSHFANDNQPKDTKMTNATTTYTVIEIACDGVWAGSGKLVDGIIEDCGAQFCDDNDESLECYDLIESAIAKGRDSVKVKLSSGNTIRLTWSITPPMVNAE
jgi:hypothetical protein